MECCSARAIPKMGCDQGDMGGLAATTSTSCTHQRRTLGLLIRLFLHSADRKTNGAAVWEEQRRLSWKPAHY
ncbi:hypothetical protein SKAU_G00106420 [Synaphobranchus kaupii]|uniref:Uncharacterized protein n=1 Tax=Synaphobranchus kaupii TaxID=118154 RepID=A0A9Q1FZA0_SYNKA|nr:hypothetical protein SKAU_G00106420 [Synaphobranchus kaupii]